jgi:hypothetical protein
VRPISARSAEHTPSKLAAVAYRRPPLRLRAVVAGLLLVPGVTLFAVWGDWLEGGNGAAQSLNSFAVEALALFTAANALLRRWKPVWAFSAGELITIYLVLATCMSITGGIWQWGGSLAAAITSRLCRSCLGARRMRAATPLDVIAARR